MEPAVGGVRIFLLTLGAEWKASHAGVGAVIRNAAHDAQVWAAVRAIGKGITEPAVAGIKHISTAGSTHRRVGGDTGMHCARLTRHDAEISVGARRL